MSIRRDDAHSIPPLLLKCKCSPAARSYCWVDNESKQCLPSSSQVAITSQPAPNMFLRSWLGASIQKLPRLAHSLLWITSAMSCPLAISRVLKRSHHSISSSPSRDTALISL